MGQGHPRHHDAASHKAPVRNALQAALSELETLAKQGPDAYAGRPSMAANITGHDCPACGGAVVAKEYPDVGETLPAECDSCGTVYGLFRPETGTLILEPGPETPAKPDGALRTVAGDDERAARAIFEPFSKPNRWGETGTWLGPWETERCEHGRMYSFRWTVRGTAGIRPTRADFEGAEPEYGSHACRKCHPEED